MIVAVPCCPRLVDTAADSLPPRIFAGVQDLAAALWVQREHAAIQSVRRGVRDHWDLVLGTRAQGKYFTWKTRQ